MFLNVVHSHDTNFTCPVHGKMTQTMVWVIGTIVGLGKIVMKRKVEVVRPGDGA